MFKMSEKSTPNYFKGVSIVGLVMLALVLTSIVSFWTGTCSLLRLDRDT